MGETRVDLEHLLEDLRDAYPYSIAETILTEIIANSLDSGASRITMTADPAQSTLTVVDNGSGMQRKAMRQYHDIAASTKIRGQGIGFAGVGIKLGLLVCEEVLTETRRGNTHAKEKTVSGVFSSDPPHRQEGALTFLAVSWQDSRSRADQ